MDLIAGVTVVRGSILIVYIVPIRERADRESTDRHQIKNPIPELVEHCEGRPMRIITILRQNLEK